MIYNWYKISKLNSWLEITGIICYWSSYLQFTFVLDLFNLFN